MTATSPTTEHDDSVVWRFIADNRKSLINQATTDHIGIVISVVR